VTSLFGKVFRALCVGAVLAASVSPAQAELLEPSDGWLRGFDDWFTEFLARPEKKFELTLGAGVGAITDYRGSAKDGLKVAPLFRLRLYDKVTIDPMGIRVRLSSWDCCRLIAVVGRSEKRSAPDGDPVSLLPRVGAGVNVGMMFEGIVWGPLAFRVNARKEISNGHSGATVQPALGVVIRDTAETYSLIPEIAVSWADGKYMDSFFSVTPAGAAASGFTPYDAGSGIRDVLFRVTASYRFAPKWTVIARAQYSRLLGDARDSTIVRQGGSPNQHLAGVGVAYTF
jgi:outer membrane protein